MKTKIIKLSDIVIDAGTQQREKINDEVVAEYSESIKCGEKFPPVTVFFNSVEYYLADGFHRYFAHKHAEIEQIEADIHEGTKRDAKFYSLGANKAHGLRRSNGDKKKAVLEMITDSEWNELPSRDIGNHIGVSHAYVSKLRRELEEQSEENLGNVSKKPLEPALNRDDDQKLSTGDNSKNESYPQEEPEPRIPEDKILVEKEEYQELVTMLESTSKDNEAMTKVFEADDQLGTAAAEIKRLNALVVVLEERMRGFQSAENAAKRAAQMWKTKFEKLEKQVKSAGLVDF